jgi:lysophospholipase L1-like esterase
MMDRPIQHTRAWRTLLTVLAIGLGSEVAACAEEIAISLPNASASSWELPRSAITLRIEDVQGSYTIAHIQSGRELQVRIEFADAALVAADTRLLFGKKTIAVQRAVRERPSVVFSALTPGEYALECRGLDRDSRERCRIAFDHIGIGVVIAALGDSITEGYLGHGFMQKDLDLSADRFPAESVSRDGRNFPQFAPTTSHHLPSVNCFESWMTSLNNSLSAAWRQPVFIANEGWGGITTGEYLQMMCKDAGWQNRMHTLKPQVWLIHLGVNDERAHVKPADVRANLAAMVDLLIKDYHAKPNRIFPAIPSYDYAEGAAFILRSYAAEIHSLVKDRGLGYGPDFYEAFSKDQPRWYGGDPVHPNPDGMVYMARLWHEALVKQFSHDEPRDSKHDRRQ